MPTIYFVVFDQVEVLDFSGPFDVFSMARIATRSNPYDMKVVSATGGDITAIHGLRIVPDLALSQVQPTSSDIVIIPGGATDVLHAISDGDPQFPLPSNGGDPSSLTPEQKASLSQQCKLIVDWLAGPAGSAGVLCTICVGAFFGARAGIFAGHQATTHHGFTEVLDQWIGAKSRLPANQRAEVMYGPRYVTNPAGSPLVMSSGGVSAGMDLAFELLERILCPNARKRTETLMEYNGTTNFAAIQPTMPASLKLCGHIPKGDHICACGMDGPSPEQARHSKRQSFAKF